MKDIVICDIDGTISNPGDRLKYLKQDPPDWDSFYSDSFNDALIEPVADLVYTLIDAGYRIVYCTGRRSWCRTKTLGWLYRNDLIPDYDTSYLLMRKDGDLRPDAIIKPELIAEAGITLDDVALILEDRSCMVKKYRELGFTCLQVAEGDF